jgi:hypothetical protein
MAGLHDVEYTSLYWRFELMPDTKARDGLVLARQRFEYRHPDMVFLPLLSPDLHAELGEEGQMAGGLEGREIALVLNIMR